MGKPVAITDGQNVRVTKQTHDAVSKFVQQKGMLLGRFVDNAIIEKLHREVTQENPVLERNLNTNDYG